MSWFVKKIFIVAAGLLAGSSIFMSCVVAPVAFNRFPKELAGEITGSLFPAYFTVQIISAVFILLMLSLEKFRARRQHTACMVLAGLVLGSAALNLIVVLPMAREFRDQGQDQTQFRRMHATSMALNAVAVVSSLGILVGGGRTV